MGKRGVVQSGGILLVVSVSYNNYDSYSLLEMVLCIMWQCVLCFTSVLLYIHVGSLVSKLAAAQY